MGGDQAMAVIGIGTNSRASVEDVLAIVAAARAKMAEAEFGAPPHPIPLPRGERVPGVRVEKNVLRGTLPSPLGERGRVRGDSSQRSPPWTARRSTPCCKKRRDAPALTSSF